MNPRQAKAIAARVSDELGLDPPLIVVEVMALLDGETIAGFHPLTGHPEELHAPIESRILQEAED